MRAGVWMVAAMVISMPAWAAGQGEPAGSSAHVVQGAVVAQPPADSGASGASGVSGASAAKPAHPAHASHGRHAAKARGAHGNAAPHAQGRAGHEHTVTAAHANGAHTRPKAKSSHVPAHAGVQRHASGEAHAANRPHHPASAVAAAPRSVTQKHPAPNAVTVRPAQRRRLVVDAPPPRVHRAIPTPRELPPILS